MLIIINRPDNRTGMTFRSEKRTHYSQIPNHNRTVFITIPQPREKTYDVPFIFKVMVVTIKARNRMSLAIKGSRKQVYRIPHNKVRRIRDIERIVFRQDTLVHDDIGSELCAPRKIRVHIIHERGKAVQFLGTGNLVAAAHKGGRFRSNRLCRICKRSQKNDKGKQDFLFNEHSISPFRGY